MGIAPGRAAVITGAASGFGLEMARRLIAVDARVAMLDIAPVLDEVAADLGPAAVPIRCDVRSPVAAAASIRTAAERFGGLDTLIVSAGVIHIKPLAEVTEADWDLTLDVNLKGAFLAMQAAAPYIAESGTRGRIVAISSDAGKKGYPSITAYTASKFGLVGLVESVAVELAGYGVTVNAVCPSGAPSTGMGQDVLAWKVAATGKSADQVEADAARNLPLARNATVDDVAAAIEFLISDGAAYVTGSTIDVDGGARLGYLPGT